MSDKTPGKTRKGASSSKASTQNASRVTPIRESKGVTQESATRQNNESGQAGQEIAERIRIRAYQLFEERGRQEGFEREDWLRAEAEVVAKSQREKSA